MYVPFMFYNFRPPALLRPDTGNHAMPQAAFFSETGLRFLRDLAKNNNREWFNARKDTYKNELEKPARAFAASCEAALEELTGDAFAGKLFRIYRDVRFSKDKTPYNTHVRLAFFGHGKDAAAGPVKPGFYFSLETDKTILGGGAMDFAGPGLTLYRDAVADAKQGAELAGLVENLQSQGCRLDNAELKRVPRGYDAEHPRADFLKRKSLALWRETASDEFVAAGDTVALARDQFERLLPVYRWLRGLG